MRPPQLVALLIVLLALLGPLAGCGGRGLETSHTQLRFTPDARTASLTLRNESTRTTTVRSVRVEGRDWDRFTIRSAEVSGRLEPGESLVIRVEAEPVPMHSDGYASYGASQAYLLIAHDDGFTDVPMWIQPSPRATDLAWRGAAWLGTVVLAIAGLALGGARPRSRWARFGPSARGACVMLSLGLSLGAGRFGLCTIAAPEVATRGDLQRCAQGVGGTAMSLVHPGVAAMACVMAVVWFALAFGRSDAQSAGRSLERQAALRVGISVTAFAWLAPPLGLATALLSSTGQSVSQPLTLTFASAIWVVGIAWITVWARRPRPENLRA